MSRVEELHMGVVIAREEIDAGWVDYVWRPLGLVTEMPPGVRWQAISKTEGQQQFLCAAPPLELHRKETDAYRFNLSGEEPAIYVVLRENEDPADEADGEDIPVEVHLVTASPFEAQDYLDSSEEVVEPVAMPDSLRVLIEDFIDRHHREEKFKKRRRDKLDIEEHKFGQEPIFKTRSRVTRDTPNGKSD